MLSKALLMEFKAGYKAEDLTDVGETIKIEESSVRPEAIVLYRGPRV